MAMLGSAMAVSAQVQIPGEYPGTGGYEGMPQYGEMSGPAMRGNLRQPYTGGFTMPPDMYTDPSRTNPHNTETPAPTIPPFVPGYRRGNLLTGDITDEFFPTEYPGPADPFQSPYGNNDPSQYTPDGFVPNQDPFSSPYGDMDPSQYTPDGFTPNQDPFSSPYGSQDPSQYTPDGFVPNEDPFSSPYGDMDPSQ